MTTVLSPPMPWSPGTAPRPANELGKPNRFTLLAFGLSVLLLVASCLTAFGAQSGAEETSLERNVKAAFLYKFLGYVDYPDSALPGAGEPFVIGVLGADEVAEELRRISTGRTMNGRPVQVRKLRAGETPGKLHMLFVGDGEDADKALAALRQAPVLTVSDSAHNLHRDSVINFLLVDERVRFEVSLDAAERSNLKLSSRLLAVAYKVQRSGH